MNKSWIHAKWNGAKEGERERERVCAQQPDIESNRIDHKTDRQTEAGRDQVALREEDEERKKKKTNAQTCELMCCAVKAVCSSCDSINALFVLMLGCATQSGKIDGSKWINNQEGSDDRNYTSAYDRCAAAYRHQWRRSIFGSSNRRCRPCRTGRMC